MIHARLSAQDHQHIQQAAQTYGVSAGLIAAIWQDELRRLDLADHLQHAAALGLCRLPKPLAHSLRAFIERLTRRGLSTHSFGPAQMKPATLQDMAAAGLVDIPATPCEQVRMLLRRDLAPTLIAARVRQTIDHWAAGGVNLQSRPDILGTLYSLGLTGKQGVHPDPQANERGEAIAQASYAYAHPEVTKLRTSLTA